VHAGVTDKRPDGPLEPDVGTCKEGFVDDENFSNPRREIARDRLIDVRRHAHSGETAAILAQRGARLATFGFGVSYF
jgi:hypothetical protein